MGSDGNLLLGTLSAEALERAGPDVHDHQIRHVLVAADATPEFVVFPHAGAVGSVVRTSAGGQMVETGLVGGEGVLNVHALLTASAPRGSEAVVQNEGRFSRITIQLELIRRARFRRVEQKWLAAHARCLA